MSLSAVVEKPRSLRAVSALVGGALVSGSIDVEIASDPFPKILNVSILRWDAES